MKYTVTIIDTEEKFIDKFGNDAQWMISTPYGKNSIDRKHQKTDRAKVKITKKLNNRRG